MVYETSQLYGYIILKSLSHSTTLTCINTGQSAGDVSDGTPQPSSPYARSSPRSSPILDRKSEVSSEGSPMMTKKELDVS